MVCSRTTAPIASCCAVCQFLSIAKLIGDRWTRETRASNASTLTFRLWAECSTLLSGGRTSRLYRNLVQPGRATSADCVASYPGQKYPGPASSLRATCLPAQDNLEAAPRSFYRGSRFVLWIIWCRGRAWLPSQLIAYTALAKCVHLFAYLCLARQVCPITFLFAGCIH